MTAEAELLAAIYAAPDDDDARLVYADWLQDRGDPRGELIALQLQRARGPLTPAQHARERQLLAEHTPRWLAPLPISARGVRFERGFVVRCETLGFLDDHPAWATVREVNAIPATDACHTASLRVVTAIGSGGIVRLAALARALPIEELTWTGPAEWPRAPTDVAVRAWSEIRVLPRLRTLELLGQAAWTATDTTLAPADLAWVWSSRYLPALRELTLPVAPARIATWVAALTPTPLMRVELRTATEEWRSHAWRVIFDRDARGQLSRLAILAPRVPPATTDLSDAADALVRGIARLPPTLTVARVVVPGATWQAFAATRRGLEHALARQLGAQVSISAGSGR